MRRNPADPFQQDFTSLDDLVFGSVFEEDEKARANPTKAFQTIWDATQKSGGWYFARPMYDGEGGREETWSYVIPTGMYAGTYEIGPRAFRWHPHFALEFGTSAQAQAIVAQRLKKLSELTQLDEALRPLLRLVDEPGGTTAEDLDSRYNDDEWINAFREGDKAVNKLGGEYAQDAFEAAQIPDGGVGIDMMTLLDRAYASWKKDPKKYEAQRRLARKQQHFSSVALFLYILAQAAGMPVQSVLAAVRAQPKRLIGMHRVFMPTRARDRVRFARVFLQTWSEPKALKILLPNVEGRFPVRAASSAFGDAGRIQYAFNFVPSWKQLAHRTADEWRPHHSDEAAASFVLMKAKDFQELGYPAKDFREVLRRYPENLGRIVDSLRMIEDNREDLAGDVEGRRLLQQVEDRDWREVIRAHDELAERYRRGYAQPQSGIKGPEAAAWHAQARKWDLPRGVVPLTTQEEFVREGNVMRHCVGMYFWQRKSLVFSITGSDGTRATVEVSPKDGRIIQLYGPENRKPSEATVAAANELIRLNFPSEVRAVSNPQRRPVVVVFEPSPGVMEPSFQIRQKRVGFDVFRKDPKKTRWAFVETRYSVRSAVHLVRKLLIEYKRRSR